MDRSRQTADLHRAGGLRAQCYAVSRAFAFAHRRLAWLPDGDADARQAMAARIDGYCATCDPAPIRPVEELQAIFGSLKRAGFLLGVATNDGNVQCSHELLG